MKRCVEIAAERLIKVVNFVMESRLICLKAVMIVPVLSSQISQDNQGRLSLHLITCDTLIKNDLTGACVALNMT